MRARGRLAALFGAVLTVVCVASAGATTSVDRIVYMSDGGTFIYDLYTINPDGSGATDITNSPLQSDQLPDWSPDRSKIAFSTRIAGNRDIYVINADGTGLTRITSDPGNDQFATWAPDGSRILYSTNVGPQFDLYTAAADGSGDVHQITNDPGFDGDPTFSPDGEKIAYVHGEAALPFLAPPAIYLIHADGSHPKQLTPLSMNAAWPDWSPDGSRIVFANNVCPTCDLSDLFTMNLGGNNMRQITHDFGNNLQPHWSPDGTEIAFAHAGPDDFTQDIWKMDADGGNPVAVTNTPEADDQAPGW